MLEADAEEDVAASEADTAEVAVAVAVEVEAELEGEELHLLALRILSKLAQAGMLEKAQAVWSEHLISWLQSLLSNFTLTDHIVNAFENIITKH